MKECLVLLWLSDEKDSHLSRLVLRRGDFGSVEVLKAGILDYITFYNQTAKPVNWKCSALPKKTI